MSERIEDLCPQPDKLPPQPTRPLSAPLYLTSVWRCESPEQADQLLSAQEPGYVYQRDGHPNGDLLAAKCRALHRADEAVVTGSGMSALALVLLTQLEPGDRVLVSRQLYGRTLQLMTSEASRYGIEHALVDPYDLDSVEAACRQSGKLLVVETIANPRLRVADVRRLAELSQQYGVKLLVDNTFATPALCRPLELGADLVMESLTKMMNGHSDVVLGLLCGRSALWQRVPLVVSAWGLASSPMDCWLAARGLSTLHLRMQQACQNALTAARWLSECAEVAGVDYPGLASHPDHELAREQFADRYGSIVTFHLKGGREAARRFIAAARQIPFCPSLGELSTTLSHPESTSHRGLSEKQRAELGITGGTIRLSLGIESREFVLEALEQALG